LTFKLYKITEHTETNILVEGEEQVKFIF